MYYDGPEADFTELVYNPLHTTLHSNIVSNDNTESKIDKSQLIIDPTKPRLTHINEYSDYILTVNNFFNQKIYKITQNVNDLEFHFIDENGEKVNILQVHHYTKDEANPEYIIWLNTEEELRGDEPEPTVQTPYFFFFQALYNIEMELITGYN
jgi:hypothetical protein